MSEPGPFSTPRPVRWFEWALLGVFMTLRAACALLLVFVLVDAIAGGTA